MPGHKFTITESSLMPTEPTQTDCTYEALNNRLHSDCDEKVTSNQTQLGDQYKLCTLHH